MEPIREVGKLAGETTGVVIPVSELDHSDTVRLADESLPVAEIVPSDEELSEAPTQALIKPVEPSYDLNSPYFEHLLKSKLGDSFQAPYFSSWTDAAQFVQGYYGYCTSYAMPILSSILQIAQLPCGTGFAPAASNPMFPDSGICRFVSFNGVISGFAFSSTIKNGAWQIPVDQAQGEIFYYDLSDHVVSKLR